MRAHNAKPTIVYRNADGEYCTEVAKITETEEGNFSVEIPAESEGDFEFKTSKMRAESVAKFQNALRRGSKRGR
jgi:hypothetical protein